MCGIFGIASTAEAIGPASIRAGLAVQAHRGPDGEGTWIRAVGEAPYVGLGHRRLAIIDLSDAAAQPMANDDGSLVITYNGEIYNYVELMAELEAKGHRFRSHSDTEVILRAYEEWGEGCLARLNGMFAFAIWDERRRELFAARDRFGEKPFHYVADAGRGRFAFASEIKALLLLPGVEPEVDERALYRFVALNELAGSDQTLWRGVRRLPHAHFLRAWLDGDRLDVAVRRYWDIDLDHMEDMSRAEAARRFGELFADSVRLRLRSDVTVGTSLSGGLDSSAVVCQVHALGAAGGQKAFSARMEDPVLDEGQHIAAVRERTGVQGYEVWPTESELRRLFPKLCYHLEEPFIQTSQFAQHLVMRLASENGTIVLLDGQGADELLAGYTPYFLTRYADLAATWRFAALWSEEREFRTKHDRAFPLSRRAALVKAFPSLYRVARRSRDGKDGSEFRWAEMSPWWSRDWKAAFRGERPAEPRPSTRDALTRRLYDDAMCGELQELLRYGDRNSMAWSREVRQPFLDHRLAELLFALPPEFKLAGGETKLILRDAVKGLIPEGIRRRQDKLGYQAPLPTWLGGALRSWMEEGIERAAGVLDGCIARDAVDRFRAVTVWREAEARAVFSLVTVGETISRLRESALSASLS